MHWSVAAVLTILSWGVYGTLLHQGRTHLGSAYRAFLFVGIAYVFVAVISPLIAIKLTNAPGEYNTKGSTFALIAGVAGAFGAFGAILAFGLGGRPVVVMPLIFACAPMVNTVVSLAVNRPKEMPSPLFFVGIVTAAVGTWLFMTNAPH